MKFAAAAAFVLALGMPTSARASVITINFSGTADLSYFGASATSTFHGRVTWDSGSAPLILGPNYAYFPAHFESFVINSTDYAAAIDVPSVFMLLEQPSQDQISFQTSFKPFVDLGAGPDLYLFGGFLYGPTPLFPSLTLPANLDFLSVITKTGSAFAAKDVGGGNGSFVVEPVAVPEPSTMFCLGSGLIGLAYRRRRTRTSRR